MTMTDATVRSRIAEISDFEPVCGNGDCGAPAEWAVWASHTVGCQEAVLYHCTDCKTLCAQAWAEVLRDNDACICGLAYTGELGDNFRAIQL